MRLNNARRSFSTMQRGVQGRRRKSRYQGSRLKNSDRRVPGNYLSPTVRSESDSQREHKTGMKCSTTGRFQERFPTTVYVSQRTTSWYNGPLIGLARSTHYKSARLVISPTARRSTDRLPGSERLLTLKLDWSCDTSYLNALTLNT